MNKKLVLTTPPVSATNASKSRGLISLTVRKLLVVNAAAQVEPCEAGLCGARAGLVISQAR
jgi:hypothetical protein